MKWTWCLIFSCVGFLVFLIGMCLGYSHFILLKEGYETMGTVVATQTVPRAKRKGINYCPIVEFTARDGHIYRFTAVADENLKTYPIDVRVPVIYWPSNPKDASILSFRQLWKIPLIIGCTGLILLISGLTLFWPSKKEPL